MSESIRGRRTESYTKKRLAAVAAALALAPLSCTPEDSPAAPGATPTCPAPDTLPTSPYQFKNQQEVLTALNTEALPNQVWNGAILMPEGSVIHPTTFEGPQQGDSEVAPGESTIVQFPRLYKANDGTLWLGMAGSGKGITTGRATDPSHNWWINMAELQQKSNYQAFRQNDHRSPSDGHLCLPDVLSVGVTPDGNLRLAGAQGVAPNQLADPSSRPSKDLLLVIEELDLVATTRDPQ